ncbi:S-adenosylmethionine-dependent methyltransferase [Aspergillus brunneoviolaceus CBS 621.78]|uniref:SET domain-containing protein n=1 Tax=Aspergillus brunneoviolaceus CBS 621.78 TaxID=1450534 RepID=A0ACD1GCM3_9EURO|nr:SET domain-containing protein [Aspergillus brunneoviolaceus CBS 621.78]RAH47039.1 SET domain-containing protein [Aspergillus brunneoviolaceus CBS 621.78]
MSKEAALAPVTPARTTPSIAPDGLGRGLFAATDIGPGQDVLHISTPFVAVLDTHQLGDICSGCLGRRQLENDDRRLKGCTGCQVVKYCDRTCQAKDWKFAHSLECAIFQKLRPRILPINARAVLRMALRSERQKYPPQEVELFRQLETHIKDIREENPAQWQRISISSKAVKAYSGVEMKEEVISAYGAKLELNSFNLTNALYDRIGLYLHPYAALMNHSCDYNAVVGFDGDELYVKAIRPIAQGDQIFISYVDTTNPRPLRQKELRERYYFRCRCTRCEQPSDEGNDEQAPTDSAAAETQDYALLSRTSSDSSSDHPHLPAPNDLATEISAVLQNLPPTRITTQPYVSLRDELIVALLARQRYKTAFAHAAVRYLRIDPAVYPREIHPIRQVHAWALARLAVLLSQGVEVTHGGEDEVALERFEVNFSLVLWEVLRRLVVLEGRSCVVPGFQGLVRGLFGQVQAEFAAAGLDPRRMEGQIREELGKVGRLVEWILDEKV